MLDVLCGNLLVAERLWILASHEVAGIDAEKSRVLKGRWERLFFPMSLQDKVQNDDKPATLWLANFLCRFARQDKVSTEHRAAALPENRLHSYG